MKYNLKLSQYFPFAQNPGLIELDGEKILINNVILPRSIDPEHAYNPHNVRLWVIGHEFGAICAVWASHEQDAFDCAVDCNMLDCLQVSEADADDDTARFGNASEPFDLSYAWTACVEFDAARDIALIVAIVRASENGKDTL